MGGWNICLRGTSGHVVTLCQHIGPLFPESRSPSRTLTSKRPPASVARGHSRVSVRAGRLQRGLSPQVPTCFPLNRVTDQLHSSCARAQARAAHAAVHRRTRIKANASHTQTRQQARRLDLCKEKFARLVQPTCSVLSCPRPGFCPPVPRLTCCVTKDGVK